MRRFLPPGWRIFGAQSAQTRRHHHGQPVRLADHAARRRDARRARSRPTTSASSRPIARPSGSMPSPRARKSGFKVIIAGAGGAAHLPGMTASMTRCRCSACRSRSKALSGVDLLFPSCRCRPAVPVGTLAIGKSGAINAALLAASVLALTDRSARASRLEAWRSADRGRRRRAEGQEARERRRHAPPANPTPPSAFWAAASSAACWRSRRRGSASCHVCSPETRFPRLRCGARA